MGQYEDGASMDEMPVMDEAYFTELVEDLGGEKWVKNCGRRTCRV
jgi:hypothetical protein